jgi:hypothetical protein
MKNFLVLLGLLLIFSSCSPTKEHNNYKLRKRAFTLQMPTLLRTDGVYIETIKLRDSCEYHFIRFYENGRCFISTYFPGIVNDDTLKLSSKENGQRSFYRNDGNQITYEEWGGYYTGYTFVYGVIYGEELQITSYRPRGFSTAIQSMPTRVIYKFKQVSLSGDADW